VHALECAVVLNAQDWALLALIADGQPLSIGDCDVWLNQWHRLGPGSLEVPHPNYPKQRHKLWPYYLLCDKEPLLFLAGELSNGVWCFHVPVEAQPAQRCKGMTVNERLWALKLSGAFERAVHERAREQAVNILIATGLGPAQAAGSVAAVFADPGRYGFG
jgi:hypothetical protein